MSRPFPLGLPIIHGPAINAGLLAWGVARIPYVAREDFAPAWACGVVRGGRLAAVAVYHDFQPATGTAQISIAADTPRWASRQVVAAILNAAFDGLGASLRKVAAVAASSDAKAVRGLGRLGFRAEAVLRHHFALGVHAHVFGMMRGEFQRRYAGGGSR